MLIPLSSLQCHLTRGRWASTPSCIASATPFSTDPTYCLGTTPPTVLFANSWPPPRGSGSTVTVTRASPAPPHPPIPSALLFCALPPPPPPPRVRPPGAGEDRLAVGAAFQAQA